MAPPAKCLKIGKVESGAAVPERANVIAFEPSGPPALATPVAIALEYRAAYHRPSPPVYRRMKPTTGHYTAP